MMEGAEPPVQAFLCPPVNRGLMRGGVAPRSALTVLAATMVGASLLIVGLAVPATAPHGIPLEPYEHPSGFRLPVPSTWERSVNEDFEGTTIELVLYGPINGSFQTNILVETDRDPTVRETQAYLGETVRQIEAEIRQDDPDAFLSEGPTYRTMSDHAAVVAVVTYPSDEFLQRLAIVVSEPHARYWVLILTAATGDYHEYNATFDQMVDEFEITAEPSFFGDAATIGAILVVIALVAVVAIVAYGIHRRGRKAPTPYAPSGTPLPSQVVGCTACGAVNAATYQFCVTCGAALRPATVTSPAPEPAPPMPPDAGTPPEPPPPP